MATKAPFWSRPYLFVQIYSDAGNPYAVRINSKKLLGLCSLLIATFFLSVVGSLLFFRELELNRKLQERVLSYETQEKLVEHLRALSTRVVANNPDKIQAQRTIPKDVSEPMAKESNDTEDETLFGPTDSTADTTEAKTKRETAAVTSRIADLNSSCADEVCSIKLTMVPTAGGTAQGQLLMILEAEIPRIGTGNPSSNIRKRFFVYPGYQSIDELDQEKLHKLPRKNFSFSRALVTSADFTIGKLVRPLAVNLYIFDKSGNGIHHERRVIEPGD